MACELAFGLIWIGTKGERKGFIAVLEILPVDSAQKAVQVQIIKDGKVTKACEIPN